VDLVETAPLAFVVSATFRAEVPTAAMAVTAEV
jgi:hypothetical protein